jgi:predicted GNAT family N-acyltransferase
MTIQTLGLGKTSYPDMAYAPAPDRALDKLNAGNLAKKLVIFTPSGDALAGLVAIAEREIGAVAPVDTVYKVLSHNPDNFWAITRKSRYSAAHPRGEGFVAFLMLNALGLEALADGTLNGRNPDLAHLAAQNEKPAGIYVWAVCAPGILAAGVSLIFEKISSPLYRDVALYSNSITEIGRRFVETIGFRPGARINGKSVPHLHYFIRDESREIRPAYDSYRPGKNKGTGITVARSMEDLCKVMSIRSAVYMAEQDCPYEEEFDGNDASSTHLIGYCGDEPAATLRLRFFADFVKVERLAVRHEFRHTRLAFQIVRAGIELARIKGYRRAYGHARREIAGFWGRFGFRTFEGGNELVFSDHDYVEMVLEMDRHPEAVTIGVNPYVIIRPEGRWHMPGVLERSAARPVHKAAAV